MVQLGVVPRGWVDELTIIVLLVVNILKKLLIVILLLIEMTIHKIMILLIDIVTQILLRYILWDGRRPLCSKLYLVAIILFLLWRKIID